MLSYGLKGENGAVLLIGGTADDGATGVFEAIQIVADCTFDSLIAESWTGAPALTPVYPAGLVIYGKFTEISVTTGTCIAYVSN